MCLQLDASFYPLERSNFTLFEFPLCCPAWYYKKSNCFRRDCVHYILWNQNLVKLKPILISDGMISHII